MAIASLTRATTILMCKRRSGANARRRHAAIGAVGGRGLLHGMELVADRLSKQPAPDLAERVLHNALSLSCKVSFGNVLAFSPPLVVSRAELGGGLDSLDTALAVATVARDGGPERADRNRRSRREQSP